MEGFEKKQRSYWLSEERFRRSSSSPIRVQFVERGYWYEPIPKGSIGVIIGRSNAGFRGIEASIKLDSGRIVSNVSAGIVEEIK